MPFLPTTPQELNGIAPDFVLVTGDAYVDHPSFGAAIISRVLSSRGYSVAILPQPDWKTTDDFRKFGRPRLGFLVTGGNIDSMVNHYTVALHKRKTDAYSPGGAVGLRPNRATIVYSNKIREAYRDAPIILGGLEASLRRLAHYDFWDNAVRRSILLDAAADIIVYGMGESAIVEIAEALDSGLSVADLTFIDGTVFRTKDIGFLDDPLILPPFKAIKEPTAAGKKEFARSFVMQSENTDYGSARILVEDFANTFVVQNRPMKPLTAAELDRVYSLPYMRAPHPMYAEGVPAIEEVKFSITANRGCFGGCSFCALNFHQGRVVQGRSHKSIIAEAENFTHDADFKGYIHDVGGPTANFRTAACGRARSCKPRPAGVFSSSPLCESRVLSEDTPAGRGLQLRGENRALGERTLAGGDFQRSGVPCKRKCLTPSPCPNLKIDHADFAKLLKSLREIPRVKKVFIRSGIRYDYLLADPQGEAFLAELCAHHISGRLKVAPEHFSEKVLAAMGKPPFGAYLDFSEKFQKATVACKKPEQFLVPYLMSSHPGCTLNDAIALACELQRTGAKPEQVQDFYPTPGTLSTCMYYTGLDPRTGKRIFVPKGAREKATQRALIQYRLPANYEIVRAALEKAGRTDLIGYHANALIRPPRKNADTKPPKKPRNDRKPKSKRKSK